MAKVSSLAIALLAGSFGITSFEIGASDSSRRLQQYDVQLHSSDTGRLVARGALLRNQPDIFQKTGEYFGRIEADGFRRAVVPLVLSKQSKRYRLISEASSTPFRVQRRDPSEQKALYLAQSSGRPSAPEGEGSAPAAEPPQRPTETVSYKDGGKYRGQIQDGKRHGFGSYFYPNGGKYRGSWKLDKKHGSGTFTWPSGNEFVGEWQDGKRNGPGQFTWADGGTIVGTWKNGIPQKIDK